MPKIRERLRQLQEECEGLCSKEGWKSGFRLIYTSPETFVRGNSFVIAGLNPGGSSQDAVGDDYDRPFRESRYCSYLDDDWAHAGMGHSRFQRAVQGIAMIATGATPGDALNSIDKDDRREPESRIGSETADFLRSTPSLNIIPFRSRRAPKPQALSYYFWQRGEQIGWEILTLIRPKPRFVIALANGPVSPWKTILENSNLSPSDRDFQQRIGYANGSVRNYREISLNDGPLRGTLVFGLPAVIHDDIDDPLIKDNVTGPLFEVFGARLAYHKVTA